jgi:hypothetical protein
MKQYWLTLLASLFLSLAGAALAESLIKLGIGKQSLRPPMERRLQSIFGVLRAQHV